MVIINLILAVLALAKGRSRLNFSFFIISILFACWNMCVILWKGYGMQVFGVLNFICVNFIPAASLYLVAALYKLDGKSAIFRILPAYLTIAALNTVFIFTVFISPAARIFYHSYYFSLYIFIYELITLSTAYGFLIYYYRGIKFKQERLKIKYVIIAFTILFVAGMFDFSESLKWHNFVNLGNLLNTVYAAIIFYAIFRLRLLDAGVVFKNMIIYAVIAAVLTGLYYGAGRLLSGEAELLIAVHFVISIAVIYYVRRAYDYLSLLLDRMAPETSLTEAWNSYQYIKNMPAPEEDKAINILFMLRNYLEMESCVFASVDGVFISKWATEPELFPDRIAFKGEVPSRNVIIKYETGDKCEMDLLSVFEAEIIVPVINNGELTGIIVGKKQFADISFMRAEIELLTDISRTMGVYLRIDAGSRKRNKKEKAE